MNFEGFVNLTTSVNCLISDYCVTDDKYNKLLREHKELSLILSNIKFDNAKLSNKCALLNQKYEHILAKYKKSKNRCVSSALEYQSIECDYLELHGKYQKLKKEYDDLYDKNPLINRIKQFFSIDTEPEINIFEIIFGF